jgi:hypothetical protein
MLYRQWSPADNIRVAAPGEGPTMHRTRPALAAAIALLAALAAGTPALAHRDRPRTAQHVLLLSVDGLHQADLAWYVARHPASALAQLTRDGVQFTAAHTPVPSDSFPGLTALVTGGNPATTGIYYDDSFNRELLPAGTTNCAGAVPGAEVTYFEQLDRDPLALDAGQGLPMLPDAILAMTGDPRSVIDPAQLPVDPASCKPVYPHSYLRVNTVFEVARAAGLRTAWADKHPAYELLDGPSGTGVQDLFTPEINSDAPAPSAPGDWTSDNALTQRYDAYKVHAVLNEIAGMDHAGTAGAGTPAIFGMNFQSVSTAEKLPTSGGLPGGYEPDGVTPGPVLRGALDFVDAQVAAMRMAIDAAGLAGSTTIILTAKHGQSPKAPAALTRIADGPIVDALDAAWAAAHPAAAAPLVAFAIDDDAMVMWLSDRSPAAARFARRFLLGHSGVGNDVAGNPKAYERSGLSRVFAGEAAARFFHAAPDDARVPDLYGIVQHGVVYTAKQKKIAEHGGADPEDVDVPLVVAGGPVDGAEIVEHPVETTQVAPTILQLLGIDPAGLQAVRIEHTRVLPLR